MVFGSPISLFYCLTNMKQSNEHIDELIESYLSGEATEEERVQLQGWLREGEGHRLYFRKRVQTYWLARGSKRWEGLDVGRAKRKVMHRLQRPARIFRRIAASAAAIALVAGSAVFLRTHYSPADVVPAEEVQPGVTLTFGDGRQVSLDGQQQNIWHRDTMVSIEQTAARSITYTAHEASLPKQEIRYNTLRVPQGCDFHIQLSDGSQVWLNAESSLKYPEYFTSGKREVILSGEGYFEVAHDSLHPFHVYTEDADIVVLGTSFNVKAYGDEPEMVTTLIEGKVKGVYTNGDSVLLTPSLQAVYDRPAGRVVTSRVNTVEATGWKEGRIIARNRTLESILHRLSRWYGIEEVVYSRPELKEMCFYLNTDRYDELETVLDKLEKTQTLRFKVEGKKITVSE